MLLHSFSYFLFLAIVLAVYYLAAKKYKLTVLLGASYIFYALFDLRFTVLLAGLTGSSYFFGKQIAYAKNPNFYQAANIILNLGTLALFKYYNFFLSSFSHLFQSSPELLQALLPIGISFYTFQSIAYTTQIYKKKLEPQPLIDYGLYMVFFPRLIAGPFIQPQKFFTQLGNLRANRNKFISGLSLIVLGLFKKIVLADSIAILSNTAFKAAGLGEGSTSLPSPLFWQGFYLYAILIYADFSGYTDLARGSALLFGFELPKNFRQPYLAPTLTEFWNRWHMSLTAWFREYIFFPLSRTLLTWTQRKHKQLIQLSVNFITMLLIGLWHGSTWLFLLWGGWHALWLSVEKIINYKPESRWQKAVGNFITFHIVGIGWLFFRANTINEVTMFFDGLWKNGHWEWTAIYLPITILGVSLSFIIDLATKMMPNFPEQTTKFWKSISLIGMITAIIILSVLAFAKGDSIQPFIYGQF